MRIDDISIQKRKRKNERVKWFFFTITVLSVLILFVLLFDIGKKGLAWINMDFLTSFPSRKAELSGIYPSIIGSLWIIGLTALMSIPLGIGAAIYLEEYAPNHWFRRMISLNIANLAGVPSIVYGILGLTIFVRGLGFGRSILSGALTLTLLILPIIIVASQEALRSVPRAFKEGSYALGANKLQTIVKVILPYCLPRILTGIIFAISRGLGETAPLLMVGAFSYVSTLPEGPMDSFIILPIQIYSWSSRPQKEFEYIASAAILVLLFFLLSTNALAIYLRNKYQQRYED